CGEAPLRMSDASASVSDEGVLAQPPAKYAARAVSSSSDNERFMAVRPLRVSYGEAVTSVVAIPMRHFHVERARYTASMRRVCSAWVLVFVWASAFAATQKHAVTIKEWPVPWPDTHPMSPFPVRPDAVWFVG